MVARGISDDEADEAKQRREARELTCQRAEGLGRKRRLTSETCEHSGGSRALSNYLFDCPSIQVEDLSERWSVATKRKDTTDSSSSVFFPRASTLNSGGSSSATGSFSSSTQSEFNPPSLPSESWLFSHEQRKEKRRDDRAHRRLPFLPCPRSSSKLLILLQLRIWKLSLSSSNNLSPRETE